MCILPYKLVSSYAGFRPDLTIMNTMLAACVRESMWRRGIVVIHDMQNFHGLIPSAHTFDILLDCCRHTLEDPSVIYQTLCLQGLPREYAYKAAVLNAGNRISPQVALESLYETNKLPSLSGGYTESYVYGKTYMQPNLRKTHHGKFREKNSSGRKGGGRAQGFEGSSLSKSNDGQILNFGAPTSSSTSTSSSSSFVSSSFDSVSTFAGLKKGFRDSLTLQSPSFVDDEKQAVKVLKMKLIII